jgi:manganese/zinc/iron transport system permease protein
MAAHHLRRLREDASIGVVFPGLFALGVILVSRYASAVDLDIECVLYGEIAYAPWDTWSLFGVELGPKPLWVTAGTFLIDLVVVIALFKELKLSSFDPRLAAALGYSPVVLHYLLMTLTSVTVVGAFESVGAILVVAMLIVPAATAYLITDRLPRMLWLASLAGAVAAVSGYFLARALDASIAGSMAICAGLQFLLVLLFAPTYGVIGRWLVRRRLMRRLAGDLLLGKLTTDRAVRAAELAQRFGWAESRIRRALQRLEREQQVEQTPDGFRRRVEVSIEQVTLHDLGR